MKKNVLFVLVVIALLLLAGCAETAPTGKAIAQVTEPKQLEKVSVRLPIPQNDASFTAFYTALDKGFYAEEGLDVTFNNGNSETNPAKMVSSGADTFGVLGGIDTLLVARSSGLPLEAVAVLHRNSNFPGIVALESSGIKTVKDLEGKKLGFNYGHISTDVIHSLLNKENVKVQEVDVGADYSQLIAGKVDAEWVFRTTGILNLEDKGFKVVFINPADYGIVTQGYTIFTTEDTIKNNPETVQKFLRATFKGITYSIANPEDATKMFIAREPNLKYDLELKRWKEFSASMSNSAEFPPGYMDQQMFQSTYDRLEQLNVLKAPFDVKDSYTTQFIDSINKKV